MGAIGLDRKSAEVTVPSTPSDEVPGGVIFKNIPIANREYTRVESEGAPIPQSVPPKTYAQVLCATSKKMPCDKKTHLPNAKHWQKPVLKIHGNKVNTDNVSSHNVGKGKEVGQVGLEGGITLAHRTLLVSVTSVVSMNPVNTIIPEIVEDLVMTDSVTTDNNNNNVGTSIGSKKVEVPLITPWTISLAARKAPSYINMVESDEGTLVTQDTPTQKTKSQNLVKIVYYSEEGHKARVEKSKNLISNVAKFNSTNNKNGVSTAGGRIPWENTKWNKHDMVMANDDNNNNNTHNNSTHPYNTPKGNGDALGTAESCESPKNPTQKKLYNQTNNENGCGNSPKPQKNKKIFTKKNGHSATTRPGEISHVLDYRSQRVECDYFFDNHVSVISAGASEPKSTISKISMALK